MKAHDPNKPQPTRWATNQIMRRLAVLVAFVALFAFGDIAGPGDTSVFGSYHLDASALIRGG